MSILIYLLFIILFIIYLFIYLFVRVFQIVRNDRKLEQIVFPVPGVCQFLPKESKDQVIHKTKCNEQGSKVDDFFKQTDRLFKEMLFQKDLRGEADF